MIDKMDHSGIGSDIEILIYKIAEMQSRATIKKVTISLGFRDMCDNILKVPIKDDVATICGCKCIVDAEQIEPFKIELNSEV